MSFFFIEHARKKAKSPKPQLTPVNQQQIETLHRLQCKVCPLSKGGAHTPRMAPTYGDGPIYFLAEAPGRHEDETSGKPLTGPSGKLLRSVLPDTDWQPTFDNVVNCRPEGNRTPTWQETECCRPRKWSHVERAKPKLIVGLGAVPTMAMLGSTDLAGLRGRFFAVQVGAHQCWFMPTYHPSYILRRAKNKDKPLNSMFGHCFRMDIRRAYDAISYLKPPEIESDEAAKAQVSTFGGGDERRLLELLDKGRAAKEKAIDLETKGLRPYSAGAAIMAAAISFDDTNFSFAIDHPQATWTEAQKERILIAFSNLLTDRTTKIAHNAPFELEWLSWLYGPEIVRHDVWECTMMQAHFLDERRGGRVDDDNARASKYQGLDFLVKQHFGRSFKGQYKLNKKDMSKTPIEVCLTYNGDDTRQTLRLWHRQNALLKRDRSYQAYHAALPTQTAVALMQHIGVAVDQKAVKEAQGKLAKDITAIEFNINDLSVVKQYRADKGEFNLASTPQVLEIFKDYLKCPEVNVNRTRSEDHDYGKPSKSKKPEVVPPRYSVDKAVLEQIDHPLAKLMVKWRNRTKMKSTYVDGLSHEEMQAGHDVDLYPDGKLHTNFNGTATETGRLSSDGPNMQNFPKRADSWLRYQIIPPKGCVMLAVDYGQLEACTGAMCSRDTYLVKALWEDYDIHMEWAKLIDKEKPGLRGDLSMKQFRSLIKNKLVFPAFYGAANDSIAGYLSLAFGQEVTEHYVAKVMDRFWHVLSGMKTWQDDLVKNYYDTGCVSTLGGRKHRYPLNRNQVINHPFQGTAAELVSDAMSRLSALAVETRDWHIHPILNIHDDLTFCIPDKESVIEDILNIIMREMLVFDFPWVNVPLSLEVSVGPNWADLQPLGKFWSHKEFDYPNVTSNEIPASEVQGRYRSAHSCDYAEAGHIQQAPA